jgi:hypothetical protein
MASSMLAMERDGTDYPRMRAHAQLVANYLNQCSRVRWQPQHLLWACQFAANAPDRAELLQKLLKQGLRQFRKNPQFYWLAGEHECRPGARRCDVGHVINMFHRALELQDDPDFPLTSDQRDLARHVVGLISSLAGLASEFDGHDYAYDDDDDDDAPVDAPTLREALTTLARMLGFNSGADTRRSN